MNTEYLRDRISPSEKRRLIKRAADQLVAEGEWATNDPGYSKPMGAYFDTFDVFEVLKSDIAKEIRENQSRRQYNDQFAPRGATPVIVWGRRDTTDKMGKWKIWTGLQLQWTLENGTVVLQKDRLAELTGV
jgi:hypothetical protein